MEMMDSLKKVCLENNCIRDGGAIALSRALEENDTLLSLHLESMMTIWPAYQHFEEDAKGSLAVGKLADFVVLSADPTAVNPEEIDQIKVEETIKEGRTIFRRGK